MVATVETITAVEEATGKYKYGFVTDGEHADEVRGILGGGERALGGGAAVFVGMRLEGDEDHAEDEDDERAPLELREGLVEEDPAKGGGEEDLGLLDDGKGSRVDPAEADEAEHVHREIDEGGDRHLARVAQQPQQPRP